jgi:MFS family permease
LPYATATRASAESCSFNSAFLLSILLVALDQTIVATALPKIVSDFDALSQVTWVASGCKWLRTTGSLTYVSINSSTDFLTNAGFMLTFGQILAVAPTKWVYLAAIAIFEIGSLICGVAPTMEVLILGRTIAGTGAAGYVSTFAT